MSRLCLLRTTVRATEGCKTPKKDGENTAKEGASDHGRALPRGCETARARVECDGSEQKTEPDRRGSLPEPGEIFYSMASGLLAMVGSGGAPRCPYRLLCACEGLVWDRRSGSCVVGEGRPSHRPFSPDSRFWRGRTLIVALPFCQYRIRVPRPPPAGYPKAPRTLGDRLRARRMDLGLSQAQVAERLCVNPWTLLNWELGRTDPQKRSLPRIHAFLASTSGPSSL